MRDFTKPPGTPVRLALSALVLALSSSVPVGQSFLPAVAFAQTGSPATTDQTPAAVLAKYCVTCHNQTRKTAGLMIDSLDLQACRWRCRSLGKNRLPNSARTRCRRQVRLGRTKPLIQSSPLTWSGHWMRQIAAKPNAGHVPVHRLNHTRYPTLSGTCSG